VIVPDIESHGVFGRCCARDGRSPAGSQVAAAALLIYGKGTVKFARVLAGLFLNCALIFSAGGAAVYYVSPSGADTNAGTSPVAAWKTVARANGHTYGPGDQLFFQGGTTYPGTLYFGPGAGGNSSNPVVVGSYGAGRATLDGGTTNAIFAYDCGGMVVSNLNFIGAGASSNLNSGIEFYNDGFGPSRILSYLRISQVEAQGFGYDGIIIGGWNGTNGYGDVRILNADLHDNGGAGLETYGQISRVNTNFYAGYCRAWNNAGDTNRNGDGIVLGQVNNALIERCVAWTNGWRGNGGIGIWTWDSTKVTIQYCESHHNRTSGPQDGGGFDLDGGVTYSTLQYNYSHDNDGAGIGIYEYSGALPNSNNVVRFNISENDGRNNSYGGIELWDGGAGIRDCDIYNNTIFVSPATGFTPRVVYFLSAVANVRFRNNLFLANGSASLVEGPSGQSGVLFQGNDYWAGSGAFSIKWGGTTYTSLTNWRNSTALEKIGTTNTGFSVDPLLTAPGTGGTVGNADQLANLTAYMLQPYSPMRDAGLDLTGLFGINPGPWDYFGNPAPNGLGLDVGANDTRIEVSLVSPVLKSGYFQAGYIRTSPARADLRYAAQFSSDFSIWCTNCAVLLQTNSLGNGTEVVTFREATPATGSAARFSRVRVTRAP
jgi:hypothetical protein